MRVVPLCERKDVISIRIVEKKGGNKYECDDYEEN